VSIIANNLLENVSFHYRQRFTAEKQKIREAIIYRYESIILLLFQYLSDFFKLPI